MEKRKERKQKRKEKREIKIEEYLLKAQEDLGSNEFGAAKEDISEALKLDENSREAQDLLAEMEKREAEYESEQKRLRLEEEERILREKEEAVKKEKIEENLNAARERLKDNRFAKARAHCRDALKIDEGNKEASLLLGAIDKAEIEYDQKQKLLAKQEKERKRRERIQKAQEKKISKYLKRAREQYERGRVERAKRFIDRILEIDKDNREAEKLLEEIEKTQE